MASLVALAARSRCVSSLRSCAPPSCIFSNQQTLSFGAGSVRAQRHRRLLKHAKGYRGRSKNCFRIAVRAVEKAWTYAYRDRRYKKRTWRRLWIQRLNAATRQYHVSYSNFIYRLRNADISLNRKVLSELAATEPFAFKACVDVVERQKVYAQERRKLKAMG